MSTLVESLSLEELTSLYSSQIQPGAVFFIRDHVAQKEKFIVILGIDACRVSVGTLFINSEVNSNVIRSPEQRKLQYTLTASKYNFLNYDSKINASVIIKRDLDLMIKILIARNGILQGMIEISDFDYIRSIMAESKLFSKAEKQEFGLE